MDRMGGDVELVNHADGLEAVLYLQQERFVKDLLINRVIWL